MARKRNRITLVSCVVVAMLCLSALLIGLRYDSGDAILSKQEDNGNANVSTQKDNENNSLSELVDHEKSNAYTLETGEIDSLKIEWVNGTVKLKISENTDKISIVEYGNKDLTEADKLYYTESGGVLTVKWSKNSNMVSIFNWLEKDLVVEIPKALAQSLKSFSCDTVSGDIEAGDFTAVDCAMETTSGKISTYHIQSDSLRINSVSGSVDISKADSDSLYISTTSGSIKAADVAVQETEIETVSGSVELKGDFVKEVSTGSASGSVNIYASTCPDKVNMGSVSGNLHLTLPENKGFTAKYDSVSGDFYSEFSTTSSSGQEVYEDGSARFVFETVSGDMKILCA